MRYWSLAPAQPLGLPNRLPLADSELPTIRFPDEYRAVGKSHDSDTLFRMWDTFGKFLREGAWGVTD